MFQPLPLFGLGNTGKSLNVTAQDRLNLYYDIPRNPDKGQVAAYGTPGLELFSAVSASPTRGMHWFQAVNKLFVVQRGVLYEIASDGTATNRGSLYVTASPPDISGRVDMADNGTQLIIVSGTYGYIYTPATTTLARITDADFPGGDTVAFLDSYFIVNVPSSGQFQISSSYDGTAWNAADVATAESNPDDLTRIAVDRGYLVPIGELSTEFWQDTGALDFPFSRINGATAEAGLAARWSLARVDGLWTGVFRNRQGALTFAQINGYQISTISHPELDYLLNQYTSPDDAVGFAYTLGGHAFYQVTFQTDEKTWLWDSGTKLWSRLESYGLTRHRADLGRAFGADYIVSDYENGNLYKLNANVYTDNGDPIIREITGGHVFRAATYNKVICRRVRLDMEGGVGLVSGQGSDPQIMLQISRDGGHTWGSELWTGFGALGEYHQRAEWRRLGIARDFVFKLRISDPVKVVIINAVADIQEANK